MRKFALDFLPRIGTKQSVFKQQQLKTTPYFVKQTKRNFCSNNQVEITEAKNEAREFIQEENLSASRLIIKEEDILSRIIKVNSTEKFLKQVVENPKPVQLFCMACWSQPSKDFLPKILDKFVFSNNTWELAIFDIDFSPQLTTQLDIKSVPSCIQISNGNVMDGLKGVPSELDFNQFFKGLENLIKLNDSEKQNMVIVGDIKNYYLTKQYQQCYDSVRFQADDINLKDNIKLFVEMVQAYCSYHFEDIEKADQLIEGISKIDRDGQLEVDFVDKVWADLLKLQNSIGVLEEDLEYKELVRKWGNGDKVNLDDGYELAVYLIGKEKNEQAVEILLEIIKIDKNWGAKKGISKLVELFGLLGNKHSVVIDARKKLAKIMY